MSGVIALRTAFAADPALTALVPATRIVAGVLPQGFPLPAIGITSVAETDRNIASPGPMRFVSELVQATVRANDYPELVRARKAMKRAGADRIDVSVAGLTGVNIHTAGAGPDFMSPDARIHQGSIDFRIKFTEPR